MTFREILVGYPGTKSIDSHPYYQGAASRWAWRLYHHRFTRAGRWTLAIVGLAAFLFVVFWSLDTQTWVAAIFLGTPFLISAPAFVRSPRVTVRARCPARARADQTFDVVVELESQATYALPDVRVFPLGLPDALDAIDEDGLAVGSVNRGEVVATTVSLKATRRGLHRFSGWRIATDFPFGLIDAYSLQGSTVEIQVDPVPAPVFLNPPAGESRDGSGSAESLRTSGNTLEFAGNRPWRMGDRPRDVDWRATARHLGSPGATLVVREWLRWEPIPVVLWLDLAVPAVPRSLFRRLEDPTRRVDPLVEGAVSLAAGVVDACRDQRHELHFMETVESAHPGLGQMTTHQIARRLAAAQACAPDHFDSAALRAALPDNSAALIWIATHWTPERSEMLRNLRQAGSDIRAVLVTEEQPTSAAELPLTCIPLSEIGHRRIAL